MQYMHNIMILSDRIKITLLLKYFWKIFFLTKYVNGIKML